MRRHAEREDLNQYWYSAYTIDVLRQVCGRLACPAPLRESVDLVDSRGRWKGPYLRTRPADAVPVVFHTVATLEDFHYTIQTLSGRAGGCDGAWQEIEASSTRVAFLSTPSLFFSLKDKALKNNSVLFDVCAFPSPCGLQQRSHVLHRRSLSMKGTREVRRQRCWVLTRRARAENCFDAMKAISTPCTARVGQPSADACGIDRAYHNYPPMLLPPSPPEPTGSNSPPGLWSTASRWTKHRLESADSHRNSACGTSAALAADKVWQGGGLNSWTSNGCI